MRHRCPRSADSGLGQRSSMRMLQYARSTACSCSPTFGESQESRQWRYRKGSLPAHARPDRPNSVAPCPAEFNLIPRRSAIRPRKPGSRLRLTRNRCRYLCGDAASVRDRGGFSSSLSLSFFLSPRPSSLPRILPSARLRRALNQPRPQDEERRLSPLDARRAEPRVSRRAIVPLISHAFAADPEMDSVIASGNYLGGVNFLGSRFELTSPGDAC